MEVGFIGLGVMGCPMALNLAYSGTPLVVWNRSADKSALLRDAGAQVAANPTEVFERTHLVILMLANDAALDAVLERGTPAFAKHVAGHVIVQMGTTSAEYSRALGADIRAAGGSYVEAPVSGSFKHAESGQLVAMLAGEPEVVEALRLLLKPMCHETIVCGPVPSALLMKLAVNLFLITMVTGLVEATHFAERNGLDMEQFRAALDAGPMASAVSRDKTEKLVAHDYSAQVSIAHALNNNQLVTAAARASGVASPLLDVCQALYGEAVTLGHADADVIAVAHAIEARSDAAHTGAGAAK